MKAGEQGLRAPSSMTTENAQRSLTPDPSTYQLSAQRRDKMPNVCKAEAHVSEQKLVQVAITSTPIPTTQHATNKQSITYKSSPKRTPANLTLTRHVHRSCAVKIHTIRSRTERSHIETSEVGENNESCWDGRSNGHRTMTKRNVHPVCSKIKIPNVLPESIHASRRWRTGGHTCQGHTMQVRANKHQESMTSHISEDTTATHTT